MEGFLNYFANDLKTAEKFLKKCSIAIIPILNPDGVELGLTRTDSKGVDLNRVYNAATLETPSIYAFKKIVRFLSKENLSFFLDLHSHFTKRGSFLFGNPLKKKNYRKILFYPFLLKKLIKDFSVKNSGFGTEKDESTSRKEFYQYTKLNKLYTLEVNYWGNNV